MDEAEAELGDAMGNAIALARISEGMNLTEARISELISKIPVE